MMDWCMCPLLWTHEQSTLCPQGERGASASRLLRAQSARGSICDVISECKWQSVGRLHICDHTAAAVVGSDICWNQMTFVSDGSAHIGEAVPSHILHLNAAKTASKDMLVTAWTACGSNWDSVVKRLLSDLQTESAFQRWSYTLDVVEMK